MANRELAHDGGRARPAQSPRAGNWLQAEERTLPVGKGSRLDLGFTVISEQVVCGRLNNLFVMGALPGALSASPPGPLFAAGTETQPPANSAP